MRPKIAGRSTLTCGSRAVSPRFGAASSHVATSAVEHSVLEGTQSHRTHAPPIPSRSTNVTSAPSSAATCAASYPAGPPPMITIFIVPVG